MNKYEKRMEAKKRSSLKSYNAIIIGYWTILD